MSRPEGTRVLTIAVRGEAIPQGSVSAWVPTHKGGDPIRRAPSPRNPRGAIVVNVTTDNKELKAWREAVRQVAVDELTASAAFAGAEWSWPREGAGFTVEAISFFTGPQSRWGTGRNAGALKDAAPAHPLTTPDVDKLLRAFLDALTGVVWKDDSQVTDAITRKRYAIPRGPDDDGVMAHLAVWLNAEQRGEDLPDDERVRWVPGPAGQAALI